ncbi:hypothetical protein O181_119237 [Austropuccinia psidii MF-1]|uniref:Uncharacterized protein n=1 Tax=Austropuccinia psidii MF-1 TaxID=1389203 RepID=A0A9Q3KEP2_9BASI|nr:hypothetical protein [Austropuccinia psidii MF-1]
MLKQLYPIMSSIRESSSDSEASESSIQIQTIPAPRGFITKEPFEGNSSHKSKRQECQPRGQAQIEDARTSTSSQKLPSTFDTLIKSPEAEITAIAVVRPESLSTGNNRDIPVSVQKLVYGRKTARMGSSPKTSPTDKSLVEKPKNVIRGPEEEVGPIGGTRPVEAPQASTSKNGPQQVPNKPKQAPKTNQKGKQKEKPKCNKPYPQNYRLPKEEKTAIDNVFNMAETLMEFKNKEEERLNQYFSKK